MVLISRPDRRKAAIDEARACGRLGLQRLSDEALLACADSSDSMLVEALDAHAAGLDERRRDRFTYIEWLHTNSDRLSAEVIESGCKDTGAWLRQQYTIETGKTP